MSVVPPELDGHVVMTGADGELQTSVEQLDGIVRALAGAGKAVVHFHGGLVSEEGGLGVAAELKPVYEAAGAYPVFFVWHSDAFSVLKGNLSEIAKEELFQRLLKKVLAYAGAKLGGIAGAVQARGELTPLPESVVDRELEALDRGEEPFPSLAVDAPAARGLEETPELTQGEIDAFARDVEGDDELVAQVQAAVAGETARGTESPGGSRLDPEAVAELRGRPGERALGFGTAALVKKAVKVLVAVIRRKRSGRWHGLYATVVEEVLREFYLANAGAALWTAMKKETRDTFGTGDRPRGGERFLAALQRELPAQGGPRLTLVGHSTGAVFINNLLGRIDEARRAGEGGLPQTFRAANVVFLAPACTFSDFATVVERRDHLWERFLMFTMTDEAERADRVFSFIYPHSLLYLVSGLLERDAEGRSEGAKPLVGLQRWCRGEQTAPPELPAVRALWRDEDKVIVWSPTTGERPDGFAAGARHHGDFDNDPQVKESLRRLIAAT